MANFDQSLCGSHDSVCSCAGGNFSSDAPGTALARLLAVSVSGHDGHLVGVSQPFDLGRIRRLDLRECLGNVLVRRLDSGFWDPARSREEQSVWNYLRHAGDGLARFGAALASVRNGLSAARGIGNAAGAFGAHDCQFRFFDRDYPGLARHDLSALLRGRSDLCGLCDGSVTDDSAAQSLRPGKLHHHAPYAQHGESHAGDRFDRRIPLRDRSILRLVQRQRLRALHDLEPHARAVCALLLDFDSLQWIHAAASVDQEGAGKFVGAVVDLAGGERRHVAGALRDRGDESASRLFAVVVGLLQANPMGLVDVHRHDWIFPGAGVFVHPLSADDFDLRDADDFAGGRGRGGIGPIGRISPMRRATPKLYGVMAQFDTPSRLVAAAHETYAAGYRQINGYSPFPIEELTEAIGFKRTTLPLIVLAGGIIGALGGYFMQYWMEVIDYPINVAGKPFNSWPAFVPITFECTVLVASSAAVLGMLALNKLPQPYHPVFNAPNFALATRDSFFLVIESKDPKFEHDEVMQFLKSIEAREVIDVEL